MKRYIFAILIALTALLPAALRADVEVPGQWRLHNTFDYYFSRAIDTPDRVYVLALGQKSGTDGVWAQPSGQLFVLDKDEEQLIGYNANNYLTGNVILDVAYNSARKYLLMVYDDYTIDILTDDDKVYTIPGLASASLSTSKNINAITFDPEKKKAYVATDFGYIVIDDDKKVISESRVYNQKLTGICRVGDNLLISRDGRLYISPVNNRHSSVSDFKPVDTEFNGIKYLLPLSGDKFGVETSEGLAVGTIFPDGSISTHRVDGGNHTKYSENRDGYLLSRWGCLVQLNRDGSVKQIYTDNFENPAGIFASWDMADFYLLSPREGVLMLPYRENKWAANGKLFKPNAPQPYGVFGFDWSDKAGMLVSNSTFNRIYNVTTADYPSLISACDRGEWKAVGSTATTSPVAKDLLESYQPAIDPLNEDYLWIGTRRSGLARFNMNDGSAELFAHPQHDKKSEKGFHSVFPYSDQWPVLCNVTSPSFDSNGNLWCVFNPSHVTAPTLQPLYCWKAADRKAGNVSGFKNIPVKGYTLDYENHICLATKNGNFVVFGPTTKYQGPVYLYYHGGTIDDTSDDKLYKYQTFIDQDGGQIPYLYINKFYEDPTTGYVWVCTDSGVFYFNPNDALRADSNGTLAVRRVKVSRNDGTNLADYLLDGYDVTDMASDGASRKWFTTMGAGVFVSSADGSHVLQQFNTSNSDLPSDNVYSVGFDPTGNAVWFGTSKQIATYYCDAMPAAEDFSEILAFPNPVRPEYLGPVTIKGLMDNSLVKIVDASGSIVKELGLSNGGMAMWDLTDLQGRDVGAGVYYILTSTSSESVDAKGASSKILVIR